MSLTEWLAAALSALGVALTARRSLFCWPVSLTGTLLYAWVFLDARLYADMALQIVFCGFLVYGWLHWARAAALVVARPGARGIVLGMTAGLIGAAVWGAMLARWTNDPAPFADAGLSAFSLVAQYWMARRYRLCWPAWVVIDALYVALFLSRGLMPTALLYGGFVGLALDGWRRWQPEQGAPAGQD
ncbi:nicotinamide riboside transporter PnuC [Acidomonas methanolica]|uniref:Nicotinamide riboside transporter PnuC n=1 Tax=Acidomonas methanolica NBRC 104435 TaxID=1231351 RepID=A0A023D7G3_ACIMT|nr:nicotinamide riboside transporter PnuC [Acidomonas methanolica]MBU2655129.1 nicotinamide riboside transporter PnuC [Acidomonas methanolica]TCS25166.1 nicotinamide mononucleotide transporter [Acidomonas methanolica]GAJ30103.1 transporter of nicotinamide mononucleotide PnuC [Acidomonas methanolica NBRC 104435]GBQ48845.1 transporter of nicotinamide mononucleotide PnuC [Acidomonas methanolica]GEK99661.1 transporter [Acidomonas methanolica NBRC 104435]